MSTRAIYHFVPGSAHEHAFNVYKHHDGYPEGAAQWIASAVKMAWTLPRYESDEFAASFVAANKSGGGGGVRLMPLGDWREVARKNSSDIEYAYVINGKEQTITAYAVKFAWRPGMEDSITEIGSCPLSEAATLAEHCKTDEAPIPWISGFGANEEA